MELSISYKIFARQYPKKYKSGLFYLEFLRMRESGLSYNKIKNKLKDKIPESTIYLWFKNKNIPLPYKEFLKIKKEFYKDDLEYLAIIVGHVLGDGGISKKKILHYCNTEKFLIEGFQNSVKKLFNLSPMYKKEESTGIIRLRYPRLISRILLSLFGEFSLAKGNKRITPEIDGMPIWWKVKLIQALYKDDGSVPESGYYKCVAFKQKNKNIILWVQKTLKELGIKSKLNRDSDKWHLRILNYLDIVKFKNEIGFSKGYRKQLHLEKIVEETESPHWKTKIEILELLKEGEKTRKDLSEHIDLDVGTIYGHLHGWKRNKKRSNPGLVSMDLVNVKKNGRKNIYSLNKERYNKFCNNINKEELFKKH